MAESINSRQPACRFFWTSSGCRFGERCWFRHSKADKDSYSKEPCRYYWRSGGCWNGDVCEFSHSRPERQEHGPLADIGSRITSVMNALKSTETPDMKTSKAIEKPKEEKKEIQRDVKASKSSDAMGKQCKKKKNGRARKKERLVKEKEEEKKREELRQKVAPVLNELKSAKCGLCKKVFTKIEDGDLCHQLILHYVEKFKENDETHLNYLDKDIFFEPEDPKIKKREREKQKKRGNAHYNFNHFLEDIIDAKVNEPIVSCMCASCFYHGPSAKELMKHRIECMTASKAELEEKHIRRHSHAVNRVARLFALMDLFDSMNLEEIFSKEQQAKYRRRFDIELRFDLDIMEGLEDGEESDAMRNGLESLFKQIAVGDKNADELDDESSFEEDSDIDSDHEFHPAMIPAYVREHEYGEDDSDDDYGMFGFDEDDCFELMCQGIKPWDPCAGRALAVIYGGDIDY